MNIRTKIKNSEKGFFSLLKRIYYWLMHFSIPAPKMIWRPIWIIVNFLRNTYYWIYRVFWATPIFTGCCKRVGNRFKAGTFLPYVIGKGEIFIGDNVTFHGKADFVFGGIKKEIPKIYIGNNTGFGHNVRFDISSTLIIGDDCMIAPGVSFHDSNGHHIDPDMRKAKVKIGEGQIRSVTIGNNIWIGHGAIISPGAQIGDNCVIATMAVISRKIPPNSLVYTAPNKATKIRRISKMM